MVFQHRNIKMVVAFMFAIGTDKLDRSRIDVVVVF